jgi:hypothetical protein
MILRLIPVEIFMTAHTTPTICADASARPSLNMTTATKRASRSWFFIALCVTPIDEAKPRGLNP